MPATSRQIEKFLASLEPEIRRAFLEDVAAIRYRTNIGALESAIAAGDISAALYALGVRESDWGNLVEALRATYNRSGAFGVSSDVPARFGMRFNINNPRAQSWLTQHSSQLIVDIGNTQRQAIQQVIAAGFGQGRSPRNIALDIAGRVSTQTGRRTGGVIGLHQRYSDAAIHARTELTELNSNYFSRVRRDRRFDAAVRRSIESGEPLSQSMIDRIVVRYEDRLLQSRSEAIARTEALTSMQAAGHEAISQVVDDGLADADAITETWDSTLDNRTRPDHAAANGQTITHGQTFDVGGYRMRYPGDTELGAPASQTIQCRCFIRKQIDFSRTVL